MRRILSIAFALLALGSLPMFGQSCTTATCNALTANEADVLAALPSSANTNATVVVNIPASTAAWTSQITYTVPSAVTNLTIQGATSVNCTGTAGTSSYACSATDSTIIQDSYTSNLALLQITAGGSSSTLRITGLTLEGGSAGGNVKYNGLIQIVGGSGQLRFDHNHLQLSTYSPAQETNWLRLDVPLGGAADHNRIDQYSSANPYSFAFLIYGALNDTIGNGDGTWANPTPFGSTGTFSIESNYMVGGVIDDCLNSAGFTARYNYLDSQVTTMQTHGTKSPAGAIRGCRFFEFYKNYIANSNGPEGDAPTGTKVGPGMIWGNTMAGGSNFYFFNGGTDRSIGPGADTETNTPNGWGYCGTHWNGTGSAWDGNTVLDTGYPCLDGLGRGQTVQSLNGAGFPSRLNSSTGTIAWPQQYLEPVYLLMNTIGSATETEISDISSQNNRDYYYDCGSGNPTCSSGFTGAFGTGYGTLASRPSTCTPGPGSTYGASPIGSRGVAYFVTDAHSGNGAIDACTSANTWTEIYQPAVYPAPIVSGGGTTYTLSTSTSGSGLGSIACTPSGSGITAGTSYSCTATPNTGYFVGTISGCSGTQSGSSFSGSMPAASCTVNAEFKALVAHVSFSPGTGTYSGTQSVSLSTTTAAATICYTLNGTTPTDDGNGNCTGATLTYTGPITVSSSKTITAKGTKTGLVSSSVQSAAYTITVPPSGTGVSAGVSITSGVGVQ